MNLRVLVEPQMGHVGRIGGSDDLGQAIEATDGGRELGSRTDDLALLDVGADRRLRHGQLRARSLRRRGLGAQEGARGHEEEDRDRGDGRDGAGGAPRRLDEEHGQPPLRDPRPNDPRDCPRGIRGGAVK